MLCMARCSSQSTVLTSWVSQWPQTPPGRHINITNKASRTLGSGKNPEDQLLCSKRQGLQVQGSWHTNPGICKLYLAPKQHQADQLPRVCTAKGSMVDTTEMLQDIQCQQHADNTRSWPPATLCLSSSACLSDLVSQPRGWASVADAAGDQRGVAVWMLLAECSESISLNHTAHIKKCPDSIVGKRQRPRAFLIYSYVISTAIDHMAFSITISTHLPLFAVNDLVN